MTGDLINELAAGMRLRGWTIPQFARECQVNVQLAYKWLAEDERYRTTPSPRSCEKIAIALDLDPDYVLELAGHRTPRQPRDVVSAQRQAARDQLDRWIAAVGPEYEDFFWRNLKAHGDATAVLITELTAPETRTAVNAGGLTAINSVAPAQPNRADRSRTAGKRRLTSRQHPILAALFWPFGRANQPLAA